jgi:sensor histidine kinase YesM
VNQPTPSRSAPPDSKDAPWTLYILVIVLTVAALIKLLVPSINFLWSFVNSSVYAFSIYWLCKLVLRLLPQLPLWVCFAIATPVGVAIGTSFSYFVTGSTRFGAGHAIPIWQYAVIGLIFSGAAAYLAYVRSKMLRAESALQQEQLQRVNQEKLLAETRLHALQAQIEPHFIFNTLANVQSLIETDPAAAQRMLESFTRLLRVTLQRSRNGDATFGQEIEVVRAYLSIQQQRLGQRLRFTIEAPGALEALPFPALLLQPLVENAVKHGIEPAIEGGEVALSAESRGDRLVIRVQDTGRGFAEQAGNGIGLANVRERLASLYGDSAQLTLTENSTRGVCATMEVPLASVE